MHRALISLSIGDSDKPSFSPFIPPPIRRLSIPPSLSLTPTKSSLPSSSIPPRSKSSTTTTAPPAKTPQASTRPISSPIAGPSNSNPSAIFPYLHRLEICDDMSYRRQQRPLLVLNLSSPSFLDSVATDLVAETPLYSVETVGSSTTIWRSDPWDASVKIADICWPKDIPLKGKGRDTHAPIIQMGHPRWKDTGTYLKWGSLGSSSRKFSIPNYPHVLKWKRTGRTYQCTTSSCKGPIATLEVSQDGETPPRIKVYETLVPSNESVPQLDHAGISLSLLDNLFVSALLLVTQPEDWMTLRHHPNSLDAPVPDQISVHKSKSAASARQWRKIMYGEPLYPSLKTPAVDTRCNEDADVLDITDAAPLPTSIKQWRKIVYGEPLYPSLRPHSADGFDLSPRLNNTWDTASISSESVCYPATPSSAPSAGFFPSPFFDDSERTVPRTNGRYSTPLSFSPAPISPIPASDCTPLLSQPSPSPRASNRRELPAPPSSWHPPPGSQPWLHRCRSSPRLSCMPPVTRNHTQCVTEDGVLLPPTTADSDIDGAQDVPPSRSRALSSGSVVRRRLPTVPPSPTSVVDSPHTQTRRLLSSGRTLPPTPVSIPRSISSTGHRYTYSSNVVSPTVASNTMPTRPSTAQQPRRHRPEKDPDQVLGWVRGVTRAHHRRVLDCDASENQPGDSEEAPPPAYNAIDFSRPPQSLAPQH